MMAVPTLDARRGLRGAEELAAGPVGGRGAGQAGRDRRQPASGGAPAVAAGRVLAPVLQHVRRRADRRRRDHLPRLRADHPAERGQPRAGDRHSRRGPAQRVHRLRAGARRGADRRGAPGDGPGDGPGDPRRRADRDPGRGSRSWRCGGAGRRRCDLRRLPADRRPRPARRDGGPHRREPPDPAGSPRQCRRRRPPTRGTASSWARRSSTAAAGRSCSRPAWRPSSAASTGSPPRCRPRTARCSAR